MDSDLSLYRRWLSMHDEGAFAALARRHADLVADVAWRTTRDVATAEDALQEALLALALDGTERPLQVGVRAWLARIAIRAAKGAARSDRARRRREREVGAGKETPAMPSLRDDMPALSSNDVLARLDGEDACVLALRYLHGVDYGEIGRILDVAEPTARVRVHRALEHLREACGRRDADESALAALVAAVPKFTAARVAVERAIAGSLASAAAPGGEIAAGEPATAAVASHALASTRGLPLAVASALVVGAAAFVVMRPSRSDGPAAARAQDPSPRADGGLARRPSPSAAAPQGAGAPSGSVPASETAKEPGPVSASPAPVRVDGVSADRAGPPTTPVDVRLERIPLDGGDPVPIEISSVFPGSGRGMTHRVLDEIDAAGLRAGRRLQVRPGMRFTVTTDDPQAALKTAFGEVQDPVPSVVVLRVPSVGDPRLESALVEVVDFKTGEPLPDATLAWAPGLGPSGTLHSDARGRIRVAIAGEPSPGLEALLRLERSACVRAPGHRASAVTYAPPMHFEERSESLRQDALRSFLETGVWRVTLDPWPEAVARSVRVVDADGAPVAGAFVGVAYPAPRKFAEFMMGMGDGFRWTDADGRLTVATASVPDVESFVAIEVDRDGVPVEGFGLSAGAWPKEGPREVRLSRSCDVEIALDGLPERSGLSWCLDPLGRARTPADGPASPPRLDEEFAAKAREKDLVFPHLGTVVGTAEGADASVVRFRVPVGTAGSAYVSAIPTTGMSSEGRDRRVDFTTPTSGSLRLSKDWNQLPPSR